ncbi:transposase [Microvirgula aerodenitrificans]|uniref:transposase n=1 Tax=Microvirgula aerodenitrificans TaxID=57480 RepID=UPI002F42090F
MPKTELPTLRQRHSYTKFLKAQIVAECAQPGASIAAVALSHGINANLNRP